MALSGTGGSGPSGGDQTPAEELDIQEIFKKYKDRWVAIKVTGRDKNLQPTRGAVVADDMDRYRLRQKLFGLKEVCIFYAGEPAYPLLL